MGKLFLDFNFWIQGYRTVQTAHCALTCPLSMPSPPLITIGITVTITVRNHVIVMVNIILIPRVKILLVSGGGFMVSAIKFQMCFNQLSKQ